MTQEDAKEKKKPATCCQCVMIALGLLVVAACVAVGVATTTTTTTTTADDANTTSKGASGNAFIGTIVKKFSDSQFPFMRQKIKERHIPFIPEQNI